MRERGRWAWPVAIALLMAVAGRGHAMNAETIKLLVGELPLPSIMFQLGVSMTVGQTALVGLGDPAAALKAADEQLAKNADDPAAHLKRGMALEVLDRPGREGEYARAAFLFKQALDAHPDDAPARVGWAQAKVQLDAWDEARPVLKALAAEHKELWWPHMALAMDMMNNWDQGKAPTDPQALKTTLAQVMANALAQVEEALSASPGESAPRWLAAMLHWLREMPDALGSSAANASTLALVDRELREVAKACPAEPMLQVFSRWATATRAMVDAGEGDMAGLWQQLRAEDQRTLTEDELATAAMVRTEAGRIPSAYELLAIYGVLHGDDGAAEARLRESVDYDPNAAERWLAYVANLARMGDREKMTAAVTEAAQRVNNGKLHCTAAKLHAMRSEWAPAEKEAQAAVAAGDESLGLAQVMLGVVRLKSGNAAGAVEPLAAVAPHWNENGLPEAALAFALALTGKQPEAAQHIARARQLSPDEKLYQRAAEAIGG